MVKCPLLAQSGHGLVRCTCLLLTQSGQVVAALGIVFADIPVAPSQCECSALQLVVLVSLCAVLFCGIAHVMQDKDREGRHPLLLFGAESLIERLPGVGELLQVG